MANTRTVAFQVPEEMFQRIKDYLHRNNMTQKQFLLGLIERELDREQTARDVNDALLGISGFPGPRGMHLFAFAVFEKRFLHDPVLLLC